MDVTLLGDQQQIVVYGVSARSTDKTQAKDIDALAKQYWAALGQAPGSALPFFVVSKEYDERTGQFELFIGGLHKHNGLQAEQLPGTAYAQIDIRPKLGFLWGPAIGEAKRFFYLRWLPASGYQAVNLEYEYHDEKSVGNHPQLSIRFAIRKKI